MKPDDLIRWRNLSRYLSGNAESVRRHRVFNIHKDAVDDLRKRIQQWIDSQQPPK